jgi:hypothetical protein
VIKPKFRINRIFDVTSIAKQHRNAKCVMSVLLFIIFFFRSQGHRRVTEETEAITKIQPCATEFLFSSFRLSDVRIYVHIHGSQ